MGDQIQIKSFTFDPDHPFDQTDFDNMPVRLCVGDPILIYIDKKSKTQAMGLIKYIGFIEGYDMTEFVGIELLEQHSKGHDGIINGFQYFTAKKNHGMHVRISNIIRKLDGSEIMLKLQEVIAMFKKKLDQYIYAVDQRNACIEQQKQSHRDAIHHAKALLQRANDKINSLKTENNELRANINTDNILINHRSDHSSHSVSKHTDEDVEDEKQKENKSKQKTQQRRLSNKQMKLQTIDDSYALCTPIADVPLLIGQLVQSMDDRRQSFNTAPSQRTAPITPMTPVTPSTDQVGTGQFPDTKKTCVTSEDDDTFRSPETGDFMSPSQSPRKHKRLKRKKLKNVKSNLSAVTDTTLATESVFSQTDQDSDDDSESEEEETIYSDSEIEESQSTAYQYVQKKHHKQNKRHSKQSSVESPRNREYKLNNRQRSKTNQSSAFYPSQLRKGKTVNILHSVHPQHAHHSNTAYYVPAIYPNKQQQQPTQPQLDHWMKQKQLVQNNPYLDQQYLPQYNGQSANGYNQSPQNGYNQRRQLQQQQQQRNIYMQRQQMQQQQQQQQQRSVRGPKRRSIYFSDTLSGINRGSPNVIYKSKSANVPNERHQNMQMYPGAANQQHAW